MNFRGAGEGHICGGERFVYELSFVFLLFLSKLTAILLLLFWRVNQTNVIKICAALVFTLSL